MNGSWELKDKQIRGSDEDILVSGSNNANRRRTLKEAYGLREGGYNGRSTVPMLWDTETNDVVCNESYNIIQLFNMGLNGLARNPDLDLSPPDMKEEIEKWISITYPNVNNEVYRCGFAQSQEAYDKAVKELFDTLDMLENHLRSRRYLCGDKLTLADVCLFTSLVRFDVVYNGLLKCTKKKLFEYPNLHAYMRDIYHAIFCPYQFIPSVHAIWTTFSVYTGFENQIPKVAEACNFPAIMDGYYRIIFPLNPGGIRPITPAGCEH